MKQIFVVEGPEYSGKSGCAEAIHQTLTGLKYNTAMFREPGGTEFGEQVRTFLKTNPVDNTSMFFGMWFSRALLVDRMVQSSQDSNRVWVTDRFDLSTYAYQCIYTKSDLYELFFASRKYLFNRFKQAGVQVNYIILDVDGQNAHKRKQLAIANNERQAQDSTDDQIEKAFDDGDRLSEAYRTALSSFKVRELITESNHLYVDTSDKEPDEVTATVLNWVLTKVR